MTRAAGLGGGVPPSGGCEDESPLAGRAVLSEAAYLAERGVRACAAQYALALGGSYSPGAVAFVIDRGDGMADYGYAASGWAADLYRWAWTPGVPTIQRERVHGLLFGYSPDAIERFEARLPDFRVVNRPVAVRARRKLVPSLLHMDRPLRSAVGRVGTGCRALVACLGHRCPPSPQPAKRADARSVDLGARP